MSGPRSPPASGPVADGSPVTDPRPDGRGRPGAARPGAGRPGGRPHVLVTDAGRGSAVAIIRSLGRRGWEVTAADSDPWSPGFRSRYATHRLRYPDPKRRPDEAARRIADWSSGHGVDLVIPVTDEVILPLLPLLPVAEPGGTATGRERTGTKPGPALAVAPPRAVERARDKRATLELAESLGVPVPRTARVTTASEAIETAAGLAWPVVVKPERSRIRREDGSIASLTVAYAATPAELRSRMALLEGASAALLQELVVGEGHGLEVLCDRGRVVAAFEHRRIHEVPVTGGASALRESAPVRPDLLAHASRLMEELEWTGLAMVEFKVGPDGPRLMEINGRIWGSLPLAHAAGMDFGGRLADMLLGPVVVPAEPDCSYEIGVRARNLSLELAWAASVLAGRRRYPYLPWPDRREAIGALAGLLDPSVRDDLLSLHDPGPGLAEIARTVRLFGSKARPALGAHG